MFFYLAQEKHNPIYVTTAPINPLTDFRLMDFLFTFYFNAILF